MFIMLKHLNIPHKLRGSVLEAKFFLKFLNIQYYLVFILNQTLQSFRNKSISDGAPTLYLFDNELPIIYILFRLTRQVFDECVNGSGTFDINELNDSA